MIYILSQPPDPSARFTGFHSFDDEALGDGATAVLVICAVRNVDLLIVAVPRKSIPILPPELFRDMPESVITVDAGNYYTSYPQWLY